METQYFYCNAVKGGQNPGAGKEFEKATDKANEHYGNLVTYMRMKGIVPPSSTP